MRTEGAKRSFRAIDKVFSAGEVCMETRGMQIPSNLVKVKVNRFSNKFPRRKTGCQQTQYELKSSPRKLNKRRVEGTAAKDY